MGLGISVFVLGLGLCILTMFRKRKPASVVVNGDPKSAPSAPPFETASEAVANVVVPEKDEENDEEAGGPNVVVPGEVEVARGAQSESEQPGQIGSNEGEQPGAASPEVTIQSVKPTKEDAFKVVQAQLKQGVKPKKLN